MNDRFKFRYYNKEGMHEWEFPLQERVMQCTGLKDKNDRLIYEGDILKELYTNDDGIKEYFFIVKWHIGSAGFVMYDVDYKIDYTYFNEFDVNLDNFEIVGNIYENSDFLNKRGKNE